MNAFVIQLRIVPEVTLQIRAKVTFLSTANIKGIDNLSSSVF